MAVDPVTRRWIRNKADEKAAAAGMRFNEKRGKAVCDWIERYCCLYEGEYAGQPLKLMPYQKDLIMRLFGWVRLSEDWKTEAGERQWIRRFTHGALWAAKKNGKAVCLETEVPTPTGFRRFGDLSVGDRVFDETGLPCNITRVTEVWSGRPCFEVAFSDGAKVIADAEHLWTVESFRHGYQSMTLRTCEIAESVDVVNGRGESWAKNYRIPVAGAVQLPDAVLPIEPYTLGVWLGDGDSDCARFVYHNNDKRIVANLAACGTKVRIQPSSKKRGTFRATLDRANPLRGERVLCGRGHTRNRTPAGVLRCPPCDNLARNARQRGFVPDPMPPQGMQGQLRAVGLLKNKHIPPEYFQGSESQRLALLRGLMDTDGTASVKGQCSFTSVSKRLADDVFTLVASLGWKPLLTSKIARCQTGATTVAYAVTFSAFADRTCFGLPRKTTRLKPSPEKQTRSMTRHIVSVKAVPSVPVRCISVDSPSQQFLLTRSYIATHNSPYLAALELYLLCGDGEQGQKIYTAAKNGDQAKIAQRHAFEMVRQSPQLSADCKLHASVLSIQHVPTNSVMMILTGDDSRGAKAKEGLNGSVFIDECFVSGTMIATPCGQIPIEEIRAGDVVKCAFGDGVVKGVSCRTATELYEVEFSDGSRFTCTGNHRIFTEDGWVNARSLDIGAVAFSEQAVQGLRWANNAVEDAGAGRQGPGADRTELQRARVLFDLLREEVEQPDGQFFHSGEGFSHTQKNWASSSGTSRQRNAVVASAACSVARTRRRMGSRVPGSGRNGSRKRISDTLQTRSCQSASEDRNRTGRWLARHAGAAGTRRKEGSEAIRTWVVGVTRLERESPCPVFNLHVGGHPSYFAEGHLVHNCHVTDFEMMERVGRAGISRKEPLNFAVSTTGDDPSSYGHKRFKDGQDVNAGRKDDLHYLHVEYCAPENLTEAEIDERLEELGKMANPAWGHIVKPSEFRADWQRSKGNPREVARFKQYRLNLWVGSTNAWLDTVGWELGQREFTLEDLRGREVYIGLDLSRTRDMTAAAFLVPWPEDSLVVATDKPPEDGGGPLSEQIEAVRIWPMFWLPAATANARAKLFPFAEWAKNGDITLTPGAVVDYHAVEDALVEAVEQYELTVMGIYFDQHYAEEITQRIVERLGMGDEIRMAVPQTLMGLTAYAKELERRVSVGLIQHPGNAVMTWQVGHVEVWTDKNQNIRPVKPSPHSGKSIDGVMAVLDAMAGAITAVASADAGGFEAW